RISREFEVPLPALTLALSGEKGVVEVYAASVALFLVGLVVLAGLLIFSSKARWYCPGLGRVYRAGEQGRVVKVLCGRRGARRAGAGRRAPGGGGGERCPPL